MRSGLTGQALPNQDWPVNAHNVHVTRPYICCQTARGAVIGNLSMCVSHVWRVGCVVLCVSCRMLWCTTGTLSLEKGGMSQYGSAIRRNSVSAAHMLTCAEREDSRCKVRPSGAFHAFVYAYNRRVRTFLTATTSASANNLARIVMLVGASVPTLGYA